MLWFWLSSSVHLKKKGILWYVFHCIYCSLLYKNFSKPLWDVISHMISNVPLPTPGKDRVLFSIENCLLSVEAPPKDGLPHVDVWLPTLLLFCWLDSAFADCIMQIRVYRTHIVTHKMTLIFAEFRYHFSHWYSVWMWTTFANFLLLWYTKGEFYLVPTSISLNLAEIIVV